MAVRPKPVPRKRAAAKKPASTLSAGEALKAAEAAVGADPVPVKAKVAAKPATAKAAPIAKADPVAIAAATTAVDAAPEPAGDGPVVDPTPVMPIAVADEPPAELKTVKSSGNPSSESGPVEPLSQRAEGMNMMNDVIETGKKFAEDAKAKFETAYADLNEKAKAGVEKSTKAIEELSDITKGNVEALVESGKIAAKGIESLGQDAVDYSRKNFEKATASIKSFSTVKTPTEFFQLQSQLFSASFDELTKEAAKSSEALIKLAGDVAQPLTARVTVVTDKVKSLAV